MCPIVIPIRRIIWVLENYCGSHSKGNLVYLVQSSGPVYTICGKKSCCIVQFLRPSVAHPNATAIGLVNGKIWCTVSCNGLTKFALC